LELHVNASSSGATSIVFRLFLVLPSSGPKKAYKIHDLLHLAREMKSANKHEEKLNYEQGKMSVNILAAGWEKNYNLDVMTVLIHLRFIQIWLRLCVTFFLVYP